MYTNGFDLTKVNTALVGRLGWSDSSLNEANQQSRSGRKFDDGSFHALVTVPNIKATTEGITEWDAHFEQKQKAAIQRCLSGVFSEPEYIEQVVLHDRVGNTEETLTNQGQFVGYEIKVAQRQDVAVQLTSTTLYFDSEVTFNLYLFRTGNVAPLKTIAVTSVENEQTVISLDDIILKHPGTYYFGYFQSDLGIVKAISEQVTFAKTLQFAARSMQATETESDFDRVNISYPSYTFGLNLQLSSFKDYTQAIVSQPFLFDEVVGRTMEFMTLEGMISSLSSNGTERQIKESLDLGAINLYLYGQVAMQGVPRTDGLKTRLDAMYAAVRKQFYKQPKALTVNLC